MEFNRLSEYAMKRHRFDPSSKDDLKALAYFQKHHAWKDGCPFLLEWPHKDIVSMCQVFYTEHMLRNLAK